VAHSGRREMPRKAGDKVKTDRRDEMMFALLLRPAS
jgi:hypothetical protein